jgi:hypothetical protein
MDSPDSFRVIQSIAERSWHRLVLGRTPLLFLLARFVRASLDPEATAAPGLRTDPIRWHRTPRILSLVLSATLAVGGAGCGENSPANPIQPTPEATGLAISGSASFSAVNQTSQLAAVASYSNGISQNVTQQSIWKTSDAAVVSVSGTGLLTALGPGTAQISATYQERSATIQATVSSGCTYELTSPKYVALGAGGGTGTITFTRTTGTSCTWTAVVSEGSSWISVQDSTGSGDITVRYTVAPHSGPSQREAQIEVRWLGSQQGENIIITQSSQPVGCAYGLTSPKEVTFGAGGGTGTVTFAQTAGVNCTWTAAVSAGGLSWIAVQDQSGVRDITIRYTVSPNASATQREAFIEVRWPGVQQGENIVITQGHAPGDLTGRWFQGYTAVACSVNPVDCEGPGSSALFSMSLELQQIGMLVTGSYHLKYDDVRASFKQKEAYGSVSGQVSAPNVVLTLSPRVIADYGNYGGVLSGTVDDGYTRLTGIFRPTFTSPVALPRDPVTISGLNRCPECPPIESVPADFDAIAHSLVLRASHFECLGSSVAQQQRRLVGVTDEVRTLVYSRSAGRVSHESNRLAHRAHWQRLRQRLGTTDGLDPWSAAGYSAASVGATTQSVETIPAECVPPALGRSCHYACDQSGDNWLRNRGKAPR